MRDQNGARYGHALWNVGFSRNNGVRQHGTGHPLGQDGLDGLRNDAAKVDAEIRLILDAQYARARALLEKNRDKVEAMVKTLLEWETVDAYQVNDIMSGRPPRPPKVKPPEDDTSDGGASGRQSND